MGVFICHVPLGLLCEIIYKWYFEDRHNSERSLSVIDIVKVFETFQLN